MGLRNSESIINSSVRGENDDAIKLKNPPASICKELDRLIESGKLETFDLGGQPCVVVGRDTIGFERGYNVTYSLRAVVSLTEVKLQTVVDLVDTMLPAIDSKIFNREN